jgi:hypothetical protein
MSITVVLDFLKYKLKGLIVCHLFVLLHYVWVLSKCFHAFLESLIIIFFIQLEQFGMVSAMDLRRGMD